MPDNINGGNVLNSENKESLSSPQAKSPLEEVSEVSSPAPVPQAPMTPPTPIPGEAMPPADNTSEPQTTPAPDTDEFLKSILDGQPNAANNSSTPPPVETPPLKPEPLSMPGAPTPIEDESVLEKEVDKGDLLKSNQPNFEVEPSTQPKIKDEIGGMDGIVAAQDKKTLNQPPTPSESQNGGGQNISSDFQLAAQKNKPVSGRSNKLLYVVVVIVVVAIGVYSAYTMFYSKSKTTPTITSSNPVTSSSATVSTLSPDQRRKDDLYVIQQALFSYYANNGSKYPAAPEIAFLNSPGNILENALVPNYLGSLPADPDVTKNYAYKSADGTKFELTAILDNPSDPEVVVNSGKPILTVTQDSQAPGSATSTASTPDSLSAQDNAGISTDSSLSGEIVSSPVF